MSSLEASTSRVSPAVKKVTFDDIVHYDGPHYARYPAADDDDDGIELEEGGVSKGKGHSKDGQRPRARASQEKRICGVRKKIFLTIIVALLVVIAAIIGGVIGAVIVRNNDRGGSSSDKPAPRPTRTYAPFPTQHRTRDPFPAMTHAPAADT